ncbi:MAG: DUF11 domain-containing protein [Bdellovibrionales bacterium]|nr:DUF11 domain-containing protein [Bdellovibrionales bacterium]
MKNLLCIFISLIFVMLAGCVSEEGSSASGSTTNFFSVRKIVDNLLPKSESVIYFTVAVTNSTPIIRKDVEIIDTCPTGTTYFEHTAFVGSYNSSNGLWTIEELEIGELASLQIGCTLLHELSGQTVGIPQTIIREPDNVDVEYSSSSVDQITVVPISADVDTVLSVNKTIGLERETLDYTIQTTNAGPDSATNLSMNFVCPTGSTYSTHTDSGTTSYNSGTGLWTISTILRSNLETLVVKCVVDVATVSLNASVTGISSNSQDTDASGDTLVSTIPVATQCSTNFTGITNYNHIGDGLSVDTAFEIANVDQMIDLSNNGSGDWDKEFILCAGLDFTGVTTFNTIASSSSTPFSGMFNGNSQTISNYNNSGQSLFGFLQGATVKDLVVATSTHACTTDYCGIIADQVIGSSDTTTFENITIQNSVAFSTSRKYAAPVVAFVNDSSVSMTNVVNDSDITITTHANIAATDSFVGGIIGYANNAGLTFSTVNNTGDFTTDSGYIGGVVGVAYLNKSSNLNLVSNTGSFNSSQNTTSLDYMGGLFGRIKANSGSGVVSFTNGSSSGNITTAGVTAFNYVGGLFVSFGGEDAADYINADSLCVCGITIDNDSVATCSFTGGIFGFMGQGGANNDATAIANSSSAAAVTGCNFTGGFGGTMRLATSVSASSASGAVVGQSYTGGFAGSVDFNTSISGSDYTGLTVTGTS